MPPPLPAAHPARSGGPLDWSALRRVLAVRLDNLGDVVLATPALRALRRALPDGARLDLLASPAGASLAPLLRAPEAGAVDDVHVLRAVWQDASGAMPQDPAREAALVERLRAAEYDAVVVLTSFSQSPWPPAHVAYLAGVPVRVGQSREFGGSLLSHWVTPPDDAVHQVDRALHLLDAVGVPSAGPDLALGVPEAARENATAALRGAGLAPGLPYALLAPGASCPSRRYPPERFAAVAAALARDGLPVAVVGSEKEAPLVAAVVEGAGRAGIVGLAGAVDVPGLAALVDGATVAVTNNSGGMHLADAVRTPLVALFAGTELEQQYAPRGTRATLLRVPTACSPCRAFDCPYTLECLDIPPRSVVDAALSLAAAPTAGVAA
ncbi:MAG: glycosyltransferase family 9 protein [Actinomycetota bacterium]|nr:glycosyltransferase family 9 protein [Actinomycetota bacterium]